MKIPQIPRMKRERLPAAGTVRKSLLSLMMKTLVKTAVRRTRWHEQKKQQSAKHLL